MEFESINYVRRITKLTLNNFYVNKGSFIQIYFDHKYNIRHDNNSCKKSGPYNLVIDNSILDRLFYYQWMKKCFATKRANMLDLNRYGLLI